MYYSCDIHADSKGDLVAVGVKSGLITRQLQVAVADVKTSKWIGDWGVEPRTGFSSPFLAGFLEDTTSLVVAGEPTPENGVGTHWGLFATALFETSGKQLGPMRFQRYAGDGQLYPRYADAAHNRLWVFQCVVLSTSWAHQPLCPIVSMSLTGDQFTPFEYAPTLQGKKRTDLWFIPHTFATPDASTILFAEGTAVWSLNIQVRALDRLTLPKSWLHAGVAESLGEGALSPDTEIVGIGLPKYRLAFPFIVDNYVYQGMNIAVVQLHPFQLLGVVQQGRFAYTNVFAVDHRQGRTLVLFYRDDHWERQEVRSSPRL